METNNNSQPKTPMLNFVMRIKRRFTLPRCIVLGVLIVLFSFFYNPTKIELLFKAIPENALVSIYVNSISKEWDGAMENNMLMGTASVIAEEDLTELRTNEGLKWTLRLLTGKDSVVAAIDVNKDKDFDFYDGDYLAGATSVGFRRRIMELLWRIKHVPGLGPLSVTEDGVRYLDFSKRKVGPSPRNPVLALDMVDGVLCVAYTANPSDLNTVTSRINKKTSLARVFKITEEPWKLRTSKSLPKNFIVWFDSYDGILGLSSLTKTSVELRALDASKEISKSFRNVDSFEELGISREKLAAQHVAMDDTLFCGVFNSSISKIIQNFLPKENKNIKFAENELVSVSALKGPYTINLLGNLLPSIHLSTTENVGPSSKSALEYTLSQILRNKQSNYVDAQNWRTIYTPKAKGFDLISANIKFGLYSEKKGDIFNQGLASLNAVKAGTELPVNSTTGTYTLGDMFDFFGKECGSSYFIGYCNLKELLKLTNMLQANLKLATMFGVKLEKEDIQTFNTVALVIDKLAEADTLSVGISQIEEEKTKNLLNTDEVYCLSISLTGKDK